VQDFERTAKAFKLWYGVALEQREHALRGWNWGKAEFGKAELSFNVQNRPAFEIPYSEVSNTNLAGKNEVAVEFALPSDSAVNGTKGQPEGSTKNRGRKAGAGRDELVEMRFYIPGTAVKTTKEEPDGTENAEDGEEKEKEEQNAANLFYETLLDKAEIGEVAGDTFATFLDVLHLTPRSVQSPLGRLPPQILMFCAEAGSISTCTKTRSVCEAKHTTTKSSTKPSRNSSYSLRTMTTIPS
jgi:structure-specific recognition protein 1